MVKHIVAFKLKGIPTVRRELALRFRDALATLPEKIDVLQSMEVAVNQNPAENWDLVLTATFPTMADISAYSLHPAHLAAASIISGHRDDRACVDYEI